ncbi:MAG: hypothetical protein WCK90_06570 [archaeon]
MNPSEVAKHLPLLKFEIIEDIEDKAHLIFYIAKTIEDAQNKKYTPQFIDDFDTIELAIEGALYIYLHGKFDLKGNRKDLKCQVRHKIVIQEFCRGIDGGSEWSDPENDITKSGEIVIDVFVNEEDRHQTRESGYGPFNPMFGISSAYVDFIKLLESSFPSAKEAREIVSFDWHGHVFNDASLILDQLCVCGESIDGSYYNDYEENNSVKVDYFKDYVNFHKKDEMVIVGRNFYLNGEKLFGIDDLLEKFPEAEAYNILGNSFYNCEYIVDWIREAYPEVINITGGMFSVSMGKENSETEVR